jgi:hypothetical protein
MENRARSAAMSLREQVEVSVDDLICEFSYQITGIVDFGVTLDEVLGGNLPPEGVRLDIVCEGSVTGMIEGSTRVTDHFYARPDGKFEINVRGVITTEDGARIAVIASGVGTLQGDGTARIFESISLHSSFEQYSWLNRAALRVTGSVNLMTATISLRVFAA